MFAVLLPFSCWTEELQHYLCLLKSICNLCWVVTQHSSAVTQRTWLSYADYTLGHARLMTFLLGILCDLASLWKKNNSGILTLYLPLPFQTISNLFPIFGPPPPQKKEKKSSEQPTLRQEFKLSYMIFPFQECKYIISNKNDLTSDSKKSPESHRWTWISHAKGKQNFC